jgi:hypothetical protein
VVEALSYKLEGRGFETQQGELNLSMHQILLTALGPGVYSASDRNEYRKHKEFFRSAVRPARTADSLIAIFESTL